MPTACLIIIGNEILSGRTQDKNLAFLAKELNELGIPLREVRVIPDVRDTIIATLKECRPKFTYLFTTGGIGPTHDDITTEAVAAALGLPVIRHPEAERRLRAHYSAEQINPARLKMADTPAGATLIDNPVSAAPGFIIENIHVMAGVPSIMQAMFAGVKGGLRGGPKTHSRTLSANVTEGTIAAGLSVIQSQFPDVEIGSYPYIRQQPPSPPVLGTSIVLRSPDTAKLAEATETTRALLAKHAEVTDGEIA